MQKKKYPYGLIVILLVILAGYFIIHRNTAHAPVITPAGDVPTSANPSVLGRKDDLIAFSIAPGATVSGKFTATGTVKGGYFFEANIVVNILDVNKKVISSGHGTATEDWMTAGPVPFTADLDLTGLPKAPGYIAIENDNPSGLEENRKQILIPIIIQ